MLTQQTPFGGFGLRETGLLQHEASVKIHTHCLELGPRTGISFLSLAVQVHLLEYVTSSALKLMMKEGTFS